MDSDRELRSRSLEWNGRRIPTYKLLVPLAEACGQFNYIGIWEIKRG